ncbi:MAG: DUF2608 domain-containing protein [Chlamydiota bacterium]
MKFFVAAIMLLSSCCLLSQIKEIDYINEVLKEASSASIVLFDIDETLIETPSMLGGKAWRRYARRALEKVKSQEEATEIHDKITYLIAKNFIYTTVEDDIHDCLHTLYKSEIPVFGFTARGKVHWYDMPSPDGEELTIEHLKQAGIDLTARSIAVDNALTAHSSYAKRIFFAYPVEDKGELILELFKNMQLLPAKVVFVDDKLENVRVVDKACEQLGIPSVCFYYRHIELHRSFDLMVANIQLEKLLFENRVLSDEEALLLKSKYLHKNPDAFFLELIKFFETFPSSN